MALRGALLPEFDSEMASTREVLERVPQSKLAWQPHRIGVAPRLHDASAPGMHGPSAAKPGS